MKQIYALFIFVLSVFNSFGQCIPDSGITHNTPGIYPDSATGLPHAITGQPYSTVIQINVRPDTTILGLPAVIDSVNIEDVAGLPPGFTYSCSPSNCSFPGGTNGCISLNGTAPATTGIYPLVVRLRAYGSILGTPSSLADSSDDYRIVVDSTTGIGTLDKSVFNAYQNTPNPAKESTTIPVVLAHSSRVSLKVANIIGKVVLKKDYDLQRGKSNVEIDLRGMLPGIYLYTLTDGANTVTRRMIISND
jgi:hypothetical protein